MRPGAAFAAIVLAPSGVLVPVPASASAADFVRLPSPGPGEWRAVFPEPVQTLDEYRRTMGRAAPFEDRHVAVLPFGEAREGDDETVRHLAAFLGAYYMTRVRVEKRRPVPPDVPRRSMRGFGPQFLADEILKLIARDVPKGAVARLAFTSDDLYGTSPNGGYLNFVFGMGSYARRVAVFSSARYSWHYPEEPEGATPLKRVLAVAAHELGHVFGVDHCQTWFCLMNGSNSLAESDARPAHLCPECLDKLEWHLGFDRAARYGELAKIYAALGWKAEEDFSRRRAKAEGDAGPARKGGAAGGGK